MKLLLCKVPRGATQQKWDGGNREPENGAFKQPHLRNTREEDNGACSYRTGAGSLTWMYGRSFRVEGMKRKKQKPQNSNNYWKYPRENQTRNMEIYNACPSQSRQTCDSCISKTEHETQKKDNMLWMKAKWLLDSLQVRSHRSYRGMAKNLWAQIITQDLQSLHVTMWVK